MTSQRDEYERKIKALENRQVADLDLSQVNGSFTMDDYVKQLQQENSAKEREFEKERKKITEMEKIIKMRKIIMKKLEKRLKEVNSQVAELNLIAQELGRKVKFTLDLAPCYLEDESAIYSIEELIRVKVMNEEACQLFFWDMNKLNDRQFLIREMLDKYFETEVVEKVEQEHDPFWDPEEAVDCGRAFITLKPISVLFDVEKSLKIYYESEVIGSVLVSLDPCDSLGQSLSSEDTGSITDCMQLLGKSLSFRVSITKANISPQFTRYCYFEYKLGHESYGSETFTTSKVQSESGILNFEYSRVHTVDVLDQSSLIYFSSGKIDFHFFSKLTYVDALMEEASTEGYSFQSADAKR